MLRIDTEFALGLLANCHSRKHFWQVLCKFDTQGVDRMAVMTALQDRFPLDFGQQALTRGA